MNQFDALLENAGLRPLTAADVTTLQVNLGLVCNQSCAHCHLQAGPDRTEMMSRGTIDIVLDILRQGQIRILDVTGGAPEMHPEFRYLVSGARALGVEVIDRCNLTVLLLPGQSGTAEFLRDQGVQINASLPCYTRDNVDSVRGKGVFDESIRALRLLNSLGYGSNPELVLNLVYNPAKPTLSPQPGELECDYRDELANRFEIRFNRLLTLTNAPVGRFEKALLSSGQLEGYIEYLARTFNPDTTLHLMCRHALSVGWDGRLYDCDFNLALAMPVNHGAPSDVNSFDYETLSSRQIVTGEQCLGCTAGCGSSCAGSLVAPDR